MNVKLNVANGRYESDAGGPVSAVEVKDGETWAWLALGGDQRPGAFPASVWASGVKGVSGAVELVRVDGQDTVRRHGINPAGGDESLRYVTQYQQLYVGKAAAGNGAQTWAITLTKPKAAKSKG